MKKISYFIISCSFLIYSNLTIAKQLSSNFLVISDIHLKSHSLQSMNFTPSTKTLTNDLNLTDFKLIINSIKDNINKNLIPKPKFIILLGDIQGHIRLLNKTEKNEAMVFKELHLTFPNTPIFYVFGNNDSIKQNYGLFSTSNSPYNLAMKNGFWKNGFLSSGEFCNKNNKSLPKNISRFPCIANENIKNGYYSALINPQLKLISLNSILFSMQRATNTDKHALDELRWLHKELAQAKINNQKILLAMHIPPGLSIYNNASFWKTKNADLFLEIVSEYHEIIISILSSHTHKDEMKIIKNQNGDIISGIFSTPALSTAFGNSPGCKIFQLSKNTNGWYLHDYQTYQFLKIKSQIFMHNLYDFQKYYCKNNSNDMLFCLKKVTTEKIAKYLNVGNTKALQTKIANLNSHTKSTNKIKKLKTENYLSSEMNFPKNIEIIVK